MDLALRMGASVDYICERTGYPMLLLAALSGNPSAVRWLDSKGVNVEALNDEGQGAIEVAFNQEKITVVDALIDIGCPVGHVWPNGDTVLHKLAKIDRSFMIRPSIIGGCNVDEKNNEGETALMISAKRGYTRTLRALLAAGADYKTLDVSKAPAEVEKIVQAWKASQFIFE